MRELSRRITFSAAQISNVINGQAQPDADFCIAVAKGLGTDPVDLLRLAGHLPPTAEQARAADPALDEIFSLYQSLPPHLKEATLLMLRGLCGPPPLVLSTARRSRGLTPRADTDTPQTAAATQSEGKQQFDNIALETYSRFFDRYPEEVERVSAYFITLLQDVIEEHKHKIINQVK